MEGVAQDDLEVAGQYGEGAGHFGVPLVELGCPFSVTARSSDVRLKSLPAESMLKELTQWGPTWRERSCSGYGSVQNTPERSLAWPHRRGFAFPQLPHPRVGPGCRSPRRSL